MTVEMVRRLAKGVACACLFISVNLFAATLTPQELMQRGVANLKSGEYQKAISRLEAAAMLRPDDVRLLYQLGLAYYNVGIEKDNISHIERAQALWRSAVALTPDDGNSMLRSTLEDIVDRAEGRKAEVADKQRLERVLRDNPTALEEGLAYARVLLKRGRRDDAAELYQRLAEVHPMDPRPYTKLAGLVSSMGRILWAERYYDQALQRDPSHEPARKGLSALYEMLEALRLEGYETLVELSH